VSWAFLIDENLPHQIAQHLRDLGVDAQAVEHVDDLGKGADDEAVIQYARTDDRIIVTNNTRDFTDAIGDQFPGVLAIDRRRTDEFEIAAAIADMIDQYEEATADGVDAFKFDHLDNYL
jgi:predicted nuclease of predicted toxin-antitoxin system